MPKSKKRRVVIALATAAAAGAVLVGASLQPASAYEQPPGTNTPAPQPVPSPCSIASKCLVKPVDPEAIKEFAKKHPLGAPLKGYGTKGSKK